MAEKVFSAPIIDNSNSAFAIYEVSEGKYTGTYNCEFYAADLGSSVEGWTAALQYRLDGKEWQHIDRIEEIAPEYDSTANLATKYAIAINLGTELPLNPIVSLTLALIPLEDKDKENTEITTRATSSTVIIQGVLDPSFTTSITNKASNVNLILTRATQTYSAIFADSLKHTITGTYSINEADSDYLSWYRVILKNSLDQVVEDSGRMPASNTNNKAFEYPLQTEFIDGTKYQAYVVYGTHKGWLETHVISIQVADNSQPAEDIEITGLTATSDAENGKIDLHITTLFNNRSEPTTLVIKRNDDGKVQTIYNDKPSASTDLIIADYSAEAGKQVSYSAYYEYVDEDETVYRAKSEEVKAILLIDDIYLLGDKLLKVKYNPDLSSLKFNYADAITPTLGAAYPFARRNGHQKYRTFTIGGLISYNSEKYESFGLNITNPTQSVFGMDSTSTFNSGTSELLNSSFLTDEDLKAYKDLDHYDRERIYEKIFRNKVLAFLHDPSIKLFKSLPEGDMLVRLSNISLTPNKQLDRNIYSFSATATEMAAATVENMIKFGITPAKLQGQLAYYNEYVLEGTMVDDETVETSSVENKDTLILEKVQTEI